MRCKSTEMKKVKTHLFTLGNFKLHLGGWTNWKIECNALREDDYEMLAWIIVKEWELKFGSVVSVPTGGDKFAEILRQYERKEASSTILIVDDVLTTGWSMEKMYDIHPMKFKIGVVIFARGKCPKWVRPIFQYYQNSEKKK